MKPFKIILLFLILPSIFAEELFLAPKSILGREKVSVQKDIYGTPFITEVVSSKNNAILTIGRALKNSALTSSETVQHYSISFKIQNLPENIRKK